MKNVILLLFFIFISVFVLNCITDSHKDDIIPYIAGDSMHQTSITVNFEYGKDFSSSAYKNIYAIWMEGKTSNFIQNISICQKLIKGGLTGTALPYWKVNKFPASSSSEIDAVTSATKANTNFSVSAVLKDNTIRNFILYFEVDRSFEPNDWFADQPSLLYSANINLDSASVYELKPIGWTPNENTQNIIPNTTMGQLQKEMRYITNHKVGTVFGAADTCSATKMVKRITATITSPGTTKFAAKTADLDISLFPNPTSGQLNIKSGAVINEVVVSNLQGQTIFRIYPNACTTTFVLNKTIAPIGYYYVRIISIKGMSIHKICITK